MSEDIEFPFLGIDQHAMPGEPPTPQAFAEYVSGLIETFEEGDAEAPFTHYLAAIMMEVFAPGFILIGSPHTLKSHDGIELPADLGFSINANTNLTTTSVGHMLGLLSDLIEESADSGLIDLTSMYGDSDDSPTG